VEKGGDHAFLVELGLLGEIQHVDPAECAIRSLLNQLLDGVRRLGISRLAQNRKQISGFAHRCVLSPHGRTVRAAKAAFRLPAFTHGVIW